MQVNFLENFAQLNNGDNSGTIWATKNIDPLHNPGKVNISKILGFRSNTADLANLGAPAAGFAYTSAFATDAYYAVADDRVFDTGEAEASSTWAETTNTPTDCDINSDIIAFNSKIYVATANFLKSLASYGGSFSNINALSSFPHSMCVFANRLYVSDNAENIESMNTSEAYSTSGANTIDLNTTTGENQLITKIAAVSNGIWIATIYTDKRGGEMIFWDGVTENVADERYLLRFGALAMVIKDDRPYIMDSQGRLRVFDGTTFKEIGRLPITDDSLSGYNDNSNDRWIHPNGMLVVDEEIYCLVRNTMSDSTLNPIENLPSGVWAWNSNYGLYHKYSFVNSDIGPNPDAIADYGVSELSKVGALFAGDATGGSVPDRDEESEFLAGITYFTDATATSTAFGITNVVNNKQKGGYLVTAQLNSKNFDEQWKEVVATFDRLKNSTDRIFIKYRTYESTPIYGTGTWAEDTRITTTTDLSSLSEGDEIEILRGKGAGACLTIDYISGTMVRFKENPLSNMSGTVRFRGQKWQEVVVIDETDLHFIKKSLDAKTGAWVQFKVFMVGTGKSPQLIKLISNSAPQGDYK